MAVILVEDNNEKIYKILFLAGYMFAGKCL